MRDRRVGGFVVRRILIALAVIFFWSANFEARAATYDIDLSTITPIGELNGACYCGPPGPEYSFAAQGGDIFNFGSIDFYVTQLGGHPDPYGIQYFVGDYDVSFISPIYLSGGVVGILLCQQQDYPCSFPTQHANLQFIVPDGDTSLSIGWVGPSLYIPPVPEPSSWLLLCIGFVFFNLARCRYGAAWKACAAVTTGGVAT